MQPILMFVVTLAAMFSSTALNFAQDIAPHYAPQGDESADFQSEVILSKLENPISLAVREGPIGTGPHELFIAESGAGQVIRISTEQTKKVNEAITGFPVGTFGIEPSLRVGPLAMVLLTRTKLAVGGGGLGAGKNVVGVYALPIGGSPVTAEQADYTVGPLSEKAIAKVGGDQFWGMVKTEEAVFSVVRGTGTTSLIFRSAIDANRFEVARTFIDSQQVAQAGPATCITVTPKLRPSFLVVGQMGSKEVANDSSISFHLPSTGALAVNLGTGLNDIVGLAYSPSGNLYALDFSWQDELAGGVYRLDDARLKGKQACRAVKIASLAKPTALAFTPEGTMYVTAFGAGENDKQGALIKITGKF